jgi:hypothetical protein
MALATLRPEFTRLALMARSINETGSINLPKQYLHITDLFSNFADLPQEMIQKLNDIHTAMEARIIRVSA